MLANLVDLVLKVLTDPAAYSLVHALAPLTEHAPLTAAEIDVMVHAQRLNYGNANAAWSPGTGPLVILAHGSSGRAAQVVPLALRIATAGFRGATWHDLG